MAGTHHGAAENGQLADLRHVLQLQIGGEDRVAADVGQHRQRAGGDDRATDRQPVQAIGEVHGIAGERDHQGNEDQEGQEGQRPKIRVMRAVNESPDPDETRLKKGTINWVEYSPCDLQSTSSASATATPTRSCRASLCGRSDPDSAIDHLAGSHRQTRWRQRPSVENTASQMNLLLRSAQSSVGTTMAIAIRTPPMVGVPAFF